jgi:hypothetical protein
MKALIEKRKQLLALLIATLAAGAPGGVRALTLECRSESVTPGVDAAKAKKPHAPVGQKFDMQVGMPAPHMEWKTTDEKYLRDFVVADWRNTVFWVNRETGEFWSLQFSATYSEGNPRVPRVIERYFEYTGRCSPKTMDQKF